VNRTTIFESPQQLPELGDIWAKFTIDNLDADLDHFVALIANSPNVVRPYVVYLESVEGSPILVVARIERTRMVARLGYWNLIRANLTGLVVSFDGIVGAQSAKDFERVVAVLRESFSSAGVDVVIIP